jgi:hypothetical protein
MVGVNETVADITKSRARLVANRYHPNCLRGGDWQDCSLSSAQAKS